MSIEDARVEPAAGGAAISAPVEQTLTRIPPAPEEPLNRAKPDKESVEALQHAMDEAIRIHLAPLADNIREALGNNDFSFSTRERLAREVTEGAPFIDAQPFLAQYPTFSEDAIFDMIVLRTAELEQALWKKPWSEYMKKFIAYHDSVK